MLNRLSEQVWRDEEPFGTAIVGKVRQRVPGMKGRTMETGWNYVEQEGRLVRDRFGLGNEVEKGLGLGCSLWDHGGKVWVRVALSLMMGGASDREMALGGGVVDKGWPGRLVMVGMFNEIYAL